MRRLQDFIISNDNTSLHNYSVSRPTGTLLSPLLLLPFLPPCVLRNIKCGGTMLDTGVHVLHMWGTVWRFWCYNSWGTLRLSCWGQWCGFQTLPAMWRGTGGVQPEKERHLVEGIWARPLLGGLGRTETSSGSPRGENKHAGGGCGWVAGPSWGVYNIGERTWAPSRASLHLPASLLAGSAT